MSAYAVVNRSVHTSEQSHRGRERGSDSRTRQICVGPDVAEIDRALGSLVGALVDRVAHAVAARLQESTGQEQDQWLDSRAAADYIGVHRDTLRRLAAARAIRSEQDARGCKLYFLRSELDAWRRNAGRPACLAAVA